MDGGDVGLKRSGSSKRLSLLKQKLWSKQQRRARERTFFAALRAVLLLRKYRVAPNAPDAPAACQSVAEACERLASNRDDDWQSRNDALLALPQLISSISADETALSGAIARLGEPLSLQLGDLRSTIVRNACAVLQDSVSAHGVSLAPLVSHVLPQLLQNLCLLKVFASPSLATAIAILGDGGAPSLGAFKALLERTKDPRKQIRKGAFELLGVLVSNRSAFAIPPKGLAAALAAFSRGIVDADGSTRGAAAASFWRASEAYPGKQVTEWLGKLGEKTPERKLLEKSRPRVRMGTQNTDASPSAAILDESIAASCGQRFLEGSEAPVDT